MRTIALTAMAVMLSLGSGVGGRDAVARGRPEPAQAQPCSLVSLICAPYPDGCSFAGLCGEVLLKNRSAVAVRVRLVGEQMPRDVPAGGAVRVRYQVHSTQCVHDARIESCVPR
jgi:hypothetical protein